MLPLRTIWLLLTLILVGVDAARGQQGAGSQLGHVAREWSARCAGPSDVAPTPGGDAIAFSELAVRVRRRVRAEDGQPTLCSRGPAFSDLCPADPGRDGASRGPSAASKAQRREWARAAKLARARPAYGPGLEPPACVVTFGIDGPRLVPLTLFD